mgnify:CR=1 FL=1
MLQLGWCGGSSSPYWGFVDGWFGRGMCYRLVGNNGLLEQADGGGVRVVISDVVWGAGWFVGLLELFGPRSHEAAKSGDSSSTHYRTDASSLAANPCPDLITDTVWQSIACLSDLPAFKGFDKTFKKEFKAFEPFLNHPEPHEVMGPHTPSLARAATCPAPAPRRPRS